MARHWALIEWNGTRDMVDETFAHVVWSSQGSEAAASRAWEWGRKNLAPVTAEQARVTYLGKESE